MKIYLIAGHSQTDPGAVNPRLTDETGRTLYESRLNVQLRDLVANYLTEQAVDVVCDPHEMSLREVIKWVRNTAVYADALLSFHFNAASPAATGTEAIIPNQHTPLEQAWGHDIATDTAQLLGIPNRGVKLEKQTHVGQLSIKRGGKGQLGILHTGVHASCLWEVGFISNENDMRQYFAKKDQLAQTIGKNISQRFVG